MITTLVAALAVGCAVAAVVKAIAEYRTLRDELRDE